MGDFPIVRRPSSITLNSTVNPSGQHRITRTYSVPDLSTRIADSYYQQTIPATNYYKPWVDHSEVGGYWYDRYRYYRNYVYNNINPYYNHYRVYPSSYRHSYTDRLYNWENPYRYYNPERYTRYWFSWPGYYSRRGIYYGASIL
uniref:Uncharacterized protein n=1 Tax=Acrobeloides nanus TaxID=290746 RepID=A0A914DLP2_9BILA